MYIYICMYIGVAKQKRTGVTYTHQWQPASTKIFVMKNNKPPSLG